MDGLPETSLRPDNDPPGPGPRPTVRTRALAIAATLAVLAVACGSSGLGEDKGIVVPDRSETTTTLGPEITYTPSYQGSIPCPNDLDIPDTLLGIECGALTVPENRYDPGTDNIVLNVIRLPARSPAKKPDPIVYLDGGPGGSGLGSAGAWYESGLLNDRDIILVAQRGTFFAGPTLDCPESRAIIFPQLSYAPDEPGSRQQRLDATGTCRHRIQDEVELWAYNSRENAHDIADLRVAMGIPEWNLLGISYGTRLALGIARDFPEGVRSIVLDSTYPTGIDSYAEFAANGQRAIDAFFASCEASSCNQRYPDLRNRFYRLLDDLEANPRSFVVEESEQTTQPVTVLWDADRLVEVVFSSLYSRFDVAQLPKLIDQFERNDLLEISQFIVDTTGRNAKYFSDGMFRSVQCRERFPFTDRAKVEQAEAAQPNPHIARALSKVEELDDCDIWNVSPAEPHENDPITSPVPTLILAGELDPITPPAWGELAGSQLPNATFLLFPGEGHGISPSPCGEEVVASFLDVLGPPATACMASLGPPEWE